MPTDLSKITTVEEADQAIKETEEAIARGEPAVIEGSPTANVEMLEKCRIELQTLYRCTGWHVINYGVRRQRGVSLLGLISTLFGKIPCRTYGKCHQQDNATNNPPFLGRTWPARNNRLGRQTIVRYGQLAIWFFWHRPSISLTY